MKNICIVDHPLIKHKLAHLRNKETSKKIFSEVLYELSIFLTYEATKKIETEPVEIETPMEIASCDIVTGDKLVIVPILRAGLGMVNGVRTVIPHAKEGHIGVYRDEEKHEPVEYYCKVPQDLEERTILLLDPMLATGGSTSYSIELLKKRGAKKIIFICVLATPEGVEFLNKNHPDVCIYTASLDRCLNENAYILPGLGDAGDRIFGTI